MRYLLSFLLFLAVAGNSFGQKTDSLYLEFIAQKMPTAYYADIYIEQCNKTNIKGMFVNLQKTPSFVPIYLPCDSTKRVQVAFVVPSNYKVNRNSYTGDHFFFGGDSVLYNVDAACFTIINKNRPGR